MKPISDAWSVVLQLNTYCGRACVYCSRLDRHLRQRDRMNMSAETLSRAIHSLKGWTRPIGIIGGEPTYHPDFPALCALLRALVPRSQLHLYTAGGPLFEKHFSRIADTFGHVAYNPHTASQVAVCRHQPFTVAVADVVPDPVLRQELIDDCWVQRTWCPCVAPWGRAYFCEVAYSWAMIQGEHDTGYELTPDWWQRTPEEFRDQRDRYCWRCGMCVPMERQPMTTMRERVSRSNRELFARLGSLKRGPEWIEPYDPIFTRADIERNKVGWKPGNFREDLRSDECAGEQWGSTK